MEQGPKKIYDHQPAAAGITVAGSVFALLSFAFWPERAPIEDSPRSADMGSVGDIDQTILPPNLDGLEAEARKPERL